MAWAVPGVTLRNPVNFIFMGHPVISSQFIEILSTSIGMTNLVWRQIRSSYQGERVEKSRTPHEKILELWNRITLLMNRQRLKSFRLRNESNTRLCVQKCTIFCNFILYMISTFIKCHYDLSNKRFICTKTRQNEEMSSSPGHASLDMISTSIKWNYDLSNKRFIWTKNSAEWRNEFVTRTCIFGSATCLYVLHGGVYL